MRPDGEDPLCRPAQLDDSAAVSLHGLRVMVGQGGRRGSPSRELAEARERAAGALAAAGARLDRVSTHGLRRALEVYLTTLRTSTGVSGREVPAQAVTPPLTWRAALGRGGPHTAATRMMLGLERLAALTPERRTRRILAARDSLVRELRPRSATGCCCIPPPPRWRRATAGCWGRLWWAPPVVAFNLAQLPVTEVPLGLDRRGLPVGAQVAAGLGRDHVSIAVALELERVFGGWTPPRG